MTVSLKVRVQAIPFADFLQVEFSQLRQSVAASPSAMPYCVSSAHVLFFSRLKLQFWSHIVFGCRCLFLRRPGPVVCACLLVCLWRRPSPCSSPFRLARAFRALAPRPTLVGCDCGPSLWGVGCFPAAGSASPAPATLCGSGASPGANFCSRQLLRIVRAARRFPEPVRNSQKASGPLSCASVGIGPVKNSRMFVGRAAGRLTTLAGLRSLAAFCASPAVAAELALVERRGVSSAFQPAPPGSSLAWSFAGPAAAQPFASLVLSSGRSSHKPISRIQGPVALAAAMEGAACPEQAPWSAAAVRAKFVEFFETQAHSHWPSSPVVPLGDPTLLFINAGMNQFKPIFLGAADPATALGALRRAVNSQKCIRAGGKHNDLEDVGKDVYHHTFFEMLGNWSFGDYFKREAIHWAWNLLTKVYKIDKDRLYVSYFGGDPSLPDCPADEEARSIWLELLPKERVLPFDAKDNFWEMADTGPCGPCSEIHFDRIGGRDASGLVNADDPSVLEIWNLVFMQFNRQEDGRLVALPAPCVDTGMGLERLLSVLQGKPSNYDTDLFVPIFEQTQRLIPGLREYQGKLGPEDEDKIDMAYRVIADHVRCLAVAIADGAVPSNEGRGYVLRRILRRAVRFGRQILGAPKEGGWLHKLVPVVVDVLGAAFPELSTHAVAIADVIKKEELQFSRTLDKGVERFNKIVRRSGLAEGRQQPGVFPGHDAFLLYATFGFPPDLTQLMAEERGLRVDMVEFDAKFAAHQTASESSAFRQLAALAAIPPESLQELRDVWGASATDESAKFFWSPDEGGTGEPVTSFLLAIWDGKQFLREASAGTSVAFIVAATPFYAEQGGQTFDLGAACSVEAEDEQQRAGTHADAEFELDVQDVQKLAEFVVHVGAVTSGTVKVGAQVELLVDYQRRALVAKNHTGTHILNFALRKVLGDACDQKGSLVEPGRLRFDFACDHQMTDKQILDVETIVKQQISGGFAVDAQEVPLDEAKRLDGLRAVFGEVYPDPVRVVAVGCFVKNLVAQPDSGAASQSSVELCGGTHLTNTNQMEDFVFIAEESISRGVRRIVAATGPAAAAARAEVIPVEDAVKAAQAASSGALQAATAKAQLRMRNAKAMPLLDKKRLAHDIELLGKAVLEASKLQTKALLKIAKDLGTELGQKHAAAPPTSPLVLNLPQLKGDGKALDAAVQAISKECPTLHAMILSNANPGGLSVIAVCPSKTPDAKLWLAAALQPVGGKGGGKVERAVGAARDVPTVEDVLRAAENFLKQ
eukprot:GHVT01088700.1.p1 GENE.GHVT01088700.1~~GHVT01088700.1.p1  ORF type:complete len:1267 (+),score=334.37 GHVT01088700.1:3-3803(+)